MATGNNHNDGASPIVAAALRVFEEFGYPVIPCSDEKRPLVKDWTNLNPLSYEDVERLFAIRDAKLVGVRTGEVSGFFVVDIDPEGAPWLAEHLAQLECRRIHTTRRAGGRHLLYRNPKGVKVKSTSKELAPGVDTRGEGGQVIWWPEHGGAVLEDDAPGDAPQWLLEQLSAHGMLDCGSGYKANGKSVASASSTPSGKQGEGRRNSTLTALAGSMRKAGFCADAIRDALHKENYERYEPALPAVEIEAIVDQCAKWERGQSPCADLGTEGIKPLDWQELDGKQPPPREWVIQDWIPASHVTLLSGQGGVGKTLLAQHLATSVASGCAYLGELKARKVLMWAGEDDERELWWRQMTVCAYMHVPMASLRGQLALYSYAGRDITLASPVFGALAPTLTLATLTEQVKEHAVQLVILDNIARLFGGSENERHSVTSFVSWVQGACAPAAVLLLGHTAKVEGSEFSGSTAWEGAVRSRLYLSNKHPDEKPGADDDAAIANDRTRYLSRRKANYSDLAVQQFSLIDGSFVLLESNASTRAFNPEFEICQQDVRVAVQKLAARDMHGATSPSSPNYLPKLAKQFGLLGELTIAQFAATMRTMVMSGKLVRDKVGMYENRSPKYGMVAK